MIKKTAAFSSRLIVLLFIGYWLQKIVLENTETLFDSELLILAYFLNGFIALAIYILIYALRKKFFDQLGFLFLLGSFLKFGVYFLFFHPKMSGTKIEFSLFFVPYVLSLILEVRALLNIFESKK
jgi:hypothetical protein